MSEGFRRQVLDFAERKATPIIRFEKGMRTDDVMHKRLRKFKAREGVDVVSPTRVGMVRHPGDHRRSRRCFPHPRGDGPCEMPDVRRVR